MGINDNDGGGAGGSAGESGTSKNGVVWDGFIVEGDGPVGIIVASIMVHIISF